MGIFSVFDNKGPQHSQRFKVFFWLFLKSAIKKLKMTIGSKFDLIIDIFVGFDLIIELNKVAPIPNIVGLGHPVKYFLL